jgi:hypothetical protein
MSRYPLSAGMHAEATGSSQKALRHLYRALGRLCQVVETMPGAQRPALDYVAADLWEAGVALGEVEGAFPLPQSAWPEGEPTDEDDQQPQDRPDRI